MAEQVSLQTAHRSASTIQRNIERLERNVNPRLVAEVLMLDLPKL